MVRVKIVYEPDNSCGRIPIKNPERSLLTGKYIDIPVSAPHDYKEILEPVKTAKRLDTKASIPRTLTPKGYTKLRLSMSVAEKQYQLLVRRCKKQKVLWEDNEFTATDKSIGKIENIGKVEWKRPKEINPNAQFMIGGAKPDDIEQGQIGDCWLLAVIASLTVHDDLFTQVVPPSQTMSDPDYVGIFRFRFWRFGEWVEILVDDRLPVRPRSKVLIFMHSSDSVEFWSALLEKAYAKLCGNYGNLSGGTQSEAMEDLTGGLCESIDLKGESRAMDLDTRLLTYSNRCCLMGSSAESESVEQKLEHGLIGGHAYSVISAKEIFWRGKNIVLVRCRNPWGGSFEWTGPWCDGSREWNDVSEKDRKELKLEFQKDGDFWMCYDDFVKYFTKFEVCHLGLESLEQNSTVFGKRRLEEVFFVGEWKSGTSAGGCLNNKDTFWTNPQFKITVVDPDPYDQDNFCTLAIGLMQKDMRIKTGGDYYSIGFMIYKLDTQTTGCLNRMFFMTHKSAGRSEYTNTREVTARLRLAPGEYVIVPSTFKQNQECSFILRVFSEVQIGKGIMDNLNTLMEVSPDVVKALTEKSQKSVRGNEEFDLLVKEFNKYKHQNGELHAHDLEKILNNSFLKEVPRFRGFNKEVCRSMVAAMDNNHTGGLELTEFQDLLDCCSTWHIIFNKKDVNKNGEFSISEFREALEEAGYKVSNKVFSALVLRYGDEDEGNVNFEDFILCMIRLKNAFETANAHPKNLEGNCCFLMEDYLRFAMYI